MEGHREETRAKAAELLLHIQGASAATAAVQASTENLAVGLERCEGITEHEESIEKAMRWQLEDGIAKNKAALQKRHEKVESVRVLGRQRAQAASTVDFGGFERAYQSFLVSSSNLAKQVSDSSDLHVAMERQLAHLETSQPSNSGDDALKQRLSKAEQLYSD
eukprot:634442-Amphidinium_carterae.1